jgi:branched-chain amino acid transport system substrate-binding protein
MRQYFAARGRPGRARSVTGTAAATAAVLLLAGCGGAGSGGESSSGGGEQEGDTTGVTDDTILIGTTQPLTGPAAPGYAKVSKAMEAYFEHLNAEGGINGRSVELIVEDDGYDPSKTDSLTKKLVEQDKVFALVGALGTPTHSQVLDYVRDSRIPDLFVASGSRLWNQPETYPGTFGWQTDYTREGKILATYVDENFPDRTYCSFGQGDDFGEDGAAGVETVLGADALKVKETYSPTNTNVAPQLGKLQAAGCDVVFSFTTPGFTSVAMGTAAQLGYRPQWVVSNVGADPTALKGYLNDAAAGLTDGMVSGTYLPLTNDKDDSWIAAFKSIHEEYLGDEAFDFITLIGYATAYTTAQALQAAGEDPTRESLVEAVEAGGLEGPGLTSFAFSPEDHSGLTGMAVTQTKDLVPALVSPVYETDNGDGPVEESSFEQPEAPANGVPE